MKPVMPDERLTEELGLSAEELALARQVLGREPSWTEWGIFAVMWSEHCSYKSSKPLLTRFPTKNEHVLQGPGENAGIVGLDETWAVAFKIESHNHPSAVEPYQGAATGVGGILRDIFTMGARPIALLDSLHFGSPRASNGDGAKAERVRALVRGVVGGIADYGNCVGIPTVGGEVHFHPHYQGNPLVNVMAVGTVRRDRITKAQATTPGCRVLYYGNATGRDGIHGATFASEVFEEGGTDRRSNVQIGDPFMEKRILEATLELIEAGAVEAIQDMGAAGLTCSSCEMASRGNTGVRINLDFVPRRARGLTPYEIMLSESQERMLAIVRKEKWELAESILRKWELPAVDLGDVTSDGLLHVDGREGEGAIFGEQATIPAAKIADASPVRSLRGEKPADHEARWALDVDAVPQPANLTGILLDLLSSPELCSRAWVWEQYDHMVRTGTALATVGGDATVLAIDGSKKGIAVTTDSCARAAWLDPRRGAMLAMAEAARNVACTGAKPIAITNNLNFGNPEKPAIFWQMQETVAGMIEACQAFNTPVTGGNVSLYNEQEMQDGEIVAILPTVVIGMLGVLESPSVATGIAAKGDRVFLAGEGSPAMDGSEYLYHVFGKLAGRPQEPDLHKEAALQRFLHDAIHKGLVRAAHDVSAGGIAVTLAEMCVAGRTGMKIELTSEHRPDIMLFGETPGLVALTVDHGQVALLRALAAGYGVKMRDIGAVGGDRLTVNGRIDAPVAEMRRAGRHVFQELFDVKRDMSGQS